LGNNQGNFELHRFTRRENTAKSFRGATFLTHTVYPRLNAILSKYQFTSWPIYFKNVARYLQSLSGFLICGNISFIMDSVGHSVPSSIRLYTFSFLALCNRLVSRKLSIALAALLTVRHFSLFR